MSTRAIIHIQEQGKPLVSIYHHWDGYPTGLGSKLYNLIRPITVVNGYSPDADEEGTANGTGCLAAKLIRRLKFDFPVGGVYIIPTDTHDMGQEFVYIINVDENNDILLTMGDADDYDSSITVNPALMERPIFNDLVKKIEAAA